MQPHLVITPTTVTNENVVQTAAETSTTSNINENNDNNNNDNKNGDSFNVKVDVDDFDHYRYVDNATDQQADVTFNTGTKVTATNDIGEYASNTTSSIASRTITALSSKSKIEHA